MQEAVGFVLQEVVSFVLLVLSCCRVGLYSGLISSHGAGDERRLLGRRLTGLDYCYGRLISHLGVAETAKLHGHHHRGLVCWAEGPTGHCLG